ncbi:MAG TPA: DinB family protein, partial [Candidatus Hydrogenedentes bacterium]|nr:DinB family protein [Candidatus Hydrogenedentota bacterium]
MNIVDAIIQEYTYEAANTRKVLERVPEDQMGWKPHQKSMSLGQLASHIAETPLWVKDMVQTDVFEM